MMREEYRRIEQALHSAKERLVVTEKQTMQATEELVSAKVVLRQ